MGRSSLIMVLGFTTALLMLGSNISKISSSAMENYIYYNNTTIAHAIAGAGVNLAARALYEDPTWTRGFSNKAFGGGVFSVTVNDLGGMKKRMTSTAKYMGTIRTVSVVLQPSSFSRFGYYSVVEGNIWWITGDTVWGPMHTQDNLQVAGSPVFRQKTTSLKSLIYNTGPKVDKPKFMGGYDTGVDIKIPSNLSPLLAAAAGGKVFTGPDSVYLEFQSNGTVKWRQGASGTVSVENLSTFAPNGVIYASGTNVHVSGVVSGSITVGAGGTTGSGKQGNIRIDGSLTYKNNPLNGPSGDLLGLVAENNVLIADNSTNNKKDIDIQASVFSRSGGFTAENWASRGVEGTINLLGGIQNNVRQPVGTFSGSPPKIASGYLKNYKYDERLMNAAPPYFPTTGQYEIVSWFE